MFLKFGEVLVEHCLQKHVRLSSVLLLLHFYEALSIPAKDEKCGEGHN